MKDKKINKPSILYHLSYYKKMFSKKCKQHLADVEENGFSHMCKALKVAIRIQFLVPLLIIHSIAPRFFTKTTTNVMNDILNTREKS